MTQPPGNFRWLVIPASSDPVVARLTWSAPGHKPVVRCKRSCIEPHRPRRVLVLVAGVLVAGVPVTGVPVTGVPVTGVPGLVTPAFPAVAVPAAAVAPARAGWATARSSASFGKEVLAAAPVLASARDWRGKVPPGLVVLQAQADVPTLDLHRYYVVSEAAAAQLPALVTSQVPTARLTTSGTGSGAQFYNFDLATWGDHEYSADLAYATTTAAGGPCLDAGGSCLLRVDSLTVWEPDRPVAETVPRSDLAMLTGFGSVGPRTSSSGAVRVHLGGAASSRLAGAFDALALGPGTFCEEDSLLYEVQFRPPGGHGTLFSVDGYACAAVVMAKVNGKPLHALFDRGCSLLNLVKALLPTSALGTRGAVAGCARPSSA